jgi:hypothetical protein
MRTFTILLALTLIAGCTTTKPASDSTPPTLTWTVVNLGTNETQTFKKSGQIFTPVGGEYRITLTAKDDGGVHKLEWHATTDFTCSQADSTSMINDVGVSFNAADTYEPNAANEVLSAVPFIRNVTLIGTTCPPGTPFDGGNTAILASTENYFAGKTKGVLNIGIKP